MNLIQNTISNVDIVKRDFEIRNEDAIMSMSFMRPATSYFVKYAPSNIQMLIIFEVIWKAMTLIINKLVIFVERHLEINQIFAITDLNIFGSRGSAINVISFLKLKNRLRDGPLEFRVTLAARCAAAAAFAAASATSSAA